MVIYQFNHIFEFYEFNFFKFMNSYEFKNATEFYKIKFAVMSYNTKFENFLDLQTYTNKVN